MTSLQIDGITGLPEIEPGTDLGALIVAQLNGDALRHGDVLVVASKVISKQEGCRYRSEEITPSPEAVRIADVVKRPPAFVELVLQQSQRIVQIAPGVLITRTHHDLVLANAGVDGSNTGAPGVYLTLPPRPDRSARLLRRRIARLTSVWVGVIISDSFGRAWRRGQTDVAIGCAGLAVFHSQIGRTDRDGKKLYHTLPCHADELAGAAELVMGKADGVPVVRIRGYSCDAPNAQKACRIPYPEEHDLFL